MIIKKKCQRRKQDPLEEEQQSKRTSLLEIKTYCKVTVIKIRDTGTKINQWINGMKQSTKIELKGKDIFFNNSC